MREGKITRAFFYSLSFQQFSSRRGVKILAGLSTTPPSNILFSVLYTQETEREGRWFFDEKLLTMYFRPTPFGSDWIVATLQVISARVPLLAIKWISWKPSRTSDGQIAARNLNCDESLCTRDTATVKITYIKIGTDEKMTKKLRWCINYVELTGLLQIQLVRSSVVEKGDALVNFDH